MRESSNDEENTNHVTSSTNSTREDDNSTAIPGVLVDGPQVPPLLTPEEQQNAKMNKFCLILFFVCSISLIPSLSYFFGKTKSSTLNQPSPPSDNDTSQPMEEPTPEISAPVATQMSWKLVNNVINGTGPRAFDGGRVGINDDGSVIALFGRKQKRMFEDIDDSWVLRDSKCGFCVESYGDEFNPDDVNQEHDINFGLGISYDGNQVISGAAWPNFGAVFAMMYSEEEGKYNYIGNKLYGRRHEDQFGAAVTMSSDGARIAVSSISGRYVNIYERASSDEGKTYVWEETFSIEDVSIGSVRTQFLSMSGDGLRLAIGVFYEGVKVFELNSLRVWEQIGQTITATELAGDLFGSSVAMSHTGHRVVISDPHMEDENGNALGAIQVFSYDSDVKIWVPLGNIMKGNSHGDYFGFSVSITADGNRVAAGAPGDQGFFIIGYVKVYDYDSFGNWILVGDQINGNAIDWFGYDLDLSREGNRLIVGAVLVSLYEARDFHGQVSVFELTAGNKTSEIQK